MKFSARQDIEAPTQKVFARITDYSSHESLAARRGIRIDRIDHPGGSADLPAWSAEFQYGGRERTLTFSVAEVVAPETFRADIKYQGLDAVAEVELVPLSLGRTRMIFRIDLRPQSIRARLAIQSLRLAKGTIQKRIQNRLRTFANEIEKP